MRPFVLDLGWPVLLERLRVAPDALLRAAALPPDLLTRQRPSVDAAGFDRLWRAMAACVDHPAPGLIVGRAVQPDSFSPPVFAAFCSPDLATALERLSLFKPLFGPVTLEVTRPGDRLSAVFAAAPGLRLPRDYVAAELVFLVSLARMATRTRIAPIAVEMVDPPDHPDYADFFGVAPRQASRNRLVLDRAAAERPFFSANPALFSVFEPDLRARLEAMGAEAGVAERLRAALMEALPAGQAGMAQMARRLGMSVRSLQRRLGAEGTSFKSEVRRLRARLAQDYLTGTGYSTAEIAFLLGYSDPNAFYRAFRGWTGSTPEAVRIAADRGAGVAPAPDAQGENFLG